MKFRDTFGSGRHIACCEHLISPIAEETLNFHDATTLCAKVKKIGTFFKQLTIAALALRKLIPLRLIQSTETWWNSTYEMLRRFILLSTEVTSIWLNLRDSPEILTASDLQLANEILKFCSYLKKLQENCVENDL